MEEQEVFPAAAAALAETDRGAIGAEMAARRGLRQSPNPAISRAG